MLAVLVLAAGFAFPAGASTEIGTAAGDTFSFLLSGDPQLGASGDLAADRAGWQASLTKATSAWEDIAFLVTAGDQINNAGNAAQLEAFLDGAAAAGLPFRPTPGNHDPDFLDSIDGLPNLDGYGNYWYAYGGALFMHLNSNNDSFGSILGTVSFLCKAVAANRDAAWRIAVFHHSVYSAASHARSSDILLRRIAYVPLFNLFGVDLALMGHDHCYVRTAPIKFYMPCEGGTTYITANSGSGSKYYDLQGEFRYALAQRQDYAPTLSKIDVTPGALTVTTYRMDTMAALDTCTISK